MTARALLDRSPDVAGARPMLIVAEAISAIAGRIRIAASDRGLCAIAFANHADRLMFHRALPPATRLMDGTNAHIARFVAELARWDHGRLPRFTVAADLVGLPPFIAEVLAALRTIPTGQVVSYGELARLAGRPRAARAVGQAMRRNPLPLVVPCHRVIASGGRIGGFTPGIAVKRILLAHEGVSLPR